MICVPKFLIFSLFVLIQFNLYGQVKGSFRTFYDQQTLRSAYLSFDLVKINDLHEYIFVQLPYASDSNVFERNFYFGLNEAYIVPEGADKLILALEDLHRIDSNLCLLVLDATRPRSVQRMMWQTVEGTALEKYVAYPEGGGSLHNIGCALDITLCLRDETPIDMGSHFDLFGKASEPRYHQELLEEGVLTEEHVYYRQILRQVMKNAGFQAINSEWWRFNVFPKELARSLYPIVE
jgi:D-alanyl-D-alanine dipeptidase